VWDSTANVRLRAKDLIIALSKALAVVALCNWFCLSLPHGALLNGGYLVTQTVLVMCGTTLIKPTLARTAQSLIMCTFCVREDNCCTCQNIYRELAEVSCT
jgi:hypothetical protein